MIDNGMSVNSRWVVRMVKVEIKYFNANYIHVVGLSLKTEIPDSLMTFKQKEKLVKGN